MPKATQLPPFDRAMYPEVSDDETRFAENVITYARIVFPGKATGLGFRLRLEVLVRKAARPASDSHAGDRHGRPIGKPRLHRWARIRRRPQAGVPLQNWRAGPARSFFISSPPTGNVAERCS